MGRPGMSGFERVRTLTARGKSALLMAEGVRRHLRMPNSALSAVLPTRQEPSDDFYHGLLGDPSGAVRVGSWRPCS